jgi:hypothetical protein
LKITERFLSQIGRKTKCKETRSLFVEVNGEKEHECWEFEGYRIHRSRPEFPDEWFMFNYHHLKDNRFRHEIKDTDDLFHHVVSDAYQIGRDSLRNTFKELLERDRDWYE